MRHRLAAGGRFLLHFWRRSLQLRVVTATILLGVIVVTSLGSYLYFRIADGLVQDRVRAARAEAARASQEAQDYLNAIDHTDSSGLNLAAYDIVQQLASVEDQRDVILLRERGRPGESTVSDLSTGRVTKAIPDNLRAAVVASPRQQQWRFVSLRYEGQTRQDPGVAIGSVVQIPVAGQYELYFVFSLQREAATADLVRRTFVIGGFVLVLLVGAVAYVVTRQVVSPVRRAVIVAERLSSGRLTERMTTKGEDDLARLGASFNTMAANLQDQIRRLEDLSRVQQRFVSDVSHELRTPMTTIRMAGEILHDSRHDFTPSVARSAELLQTQLDRFESLLADLLEISRFDAGAAALDPEPVELHDVVTRAVEASQPLAERRGSRVTIEGIDGPCIATMDPRRVERIMVNLVVNAIEHGEGRPVTVRLAASPDAVAVAVEDRGVGLREGESELVFNRFWRADPARARTSGGTGLGLAIALEDARLHGGWLQAWGEPGKGSVFRLTLPREAGHVVTSSPLALGPSSLASQVGAAYERIRPVDLPRSPAGPPVTSLRGPDA
jgi:two-component system, OmpR family, sensor histidine kinase MtrB